jgi:RHS repeat-associated protein
LTRFSAFLVHTDHLNTPRLIADDQQRTVWRWDNTDPFGGNPPDENPSGLGTFEFPLRDEGTYLDKETNLLYNLHRYRDLDAGRFTQADPLGLYGGDLSLYVLRQNNPLSYTDPTGEAANFIGGFVYGAIAGGVGGYISSGGSWQGALYGAGAGGVIGAINPFASYTAGAAAGGFTASVAGQFVGNWSNPCKDDPFDIDYTQAAIAGVAGGGSKALFNYLGNPRRTAFTYMVNQSMGPTNPVALSTAQAAVRGTISGTAQLGYKSAYYPKSYNNCSCKPN